MKRKIDKLRRAKKGRKLAGVCAGLGNFLGIDALYIRLVLVLICLFPPVSTLTAVALYIVLAYVIPEETDYIDV
ncbi:MAG: PspC domain-containing protein [Peptococcaceae bacterium]|nr:PspC domain-containing protein [Peptococcaceae bacterium]